MTTENNKLIADFRKLNTLTDNECLIAEFMEYELYAINKPYVAIKRNGSTVHFYSDWNWLMEVVEKITKTNEFQEYEFNSLFWEIFCKIEINEVYIQVVIFIEWYNEQK